MDGNGTDFSYRTVAENFRLIESGLLPVIVLPDEVAKSALAELATRDAHAGAVARKLQPYTVQVPPDARNLLFAYGHVRFVEEKRFGNQFAALKTEALYRGDIGLLWEEAEYLQLENSLGEPRVRLHLPLFILLGLYTGARKEPILSLQWSQVDLCNGRDA